MRKVLLVILLAAIGCARPARKLQQISLGDQKQEVLQKLGTPSVIRGAIRNKYGQDIEVWEYRLALPSDDSAGEVVGKSMMTVLTLGVAAQEFSSEKRDYWLYFCNGELIRWNQAGDWQVEAKNLYEVRLSSGTNL